MIRNRTELAKCFADCKFTKGAEIGVCDGRYSEILLNNIPGLDLLCVDNWQGQWAKAKPTAYKRLKDRAKIIDQPSVEVAKTVPDGSLDFVFIDADHSYEAVKADIEAWAPKVRPGGILAGHDYYMTRHGNMGVIQAVNEYADKHKFMLSFTRWDLEAHEDDRQPCWYLTKGGE